MTNRSCLIRKIVKWYLQNVWPVRLKKTNKTKTHSQHKWHNFTFIYIKLLSWVKGLFEWIYTICILTAGQALHCVNSDTNETFLYMPLIVEKVSPLFSQKSFVSSWGGPHQITSPFPPSQEARPRYPWTQSSAALCDTPLRSEDAFVSSAGPAVTFSAQRPGRPCNAAPGLGNSDARAQEAHVSHCGRTGSEPPRHPGHGKAGRTSYQARDAGKCCWRRCIPSLPTSALRRWKTPGSGQDGFFGEKVGGGYYTTSTIIQSCPLTFQQQPATGSSLWEDSTWSGALGLSTLSECCQWWWPLGENTFQIHREESKYLRCQKGKHILCNIIKYFTEILPFWKPI